MGEEAGRRFLRAYVIVAGVLGALALCCAVIAAVSYQREHVFAERGVRTRAQVVARTDCSRCTEYVTVVFVDVGGHPVRARFPVRVTTAYPPGSAIRIIYDPRHPTHARPAAGWAPAYEVWAGVGVVFLFLALGVVGWAWNWVRRVRRFAAADHPRTPVEIITWEKTWSYTATFQQWASAYERGDLLAGPPRFRVKLMPGQLDHTVSGPAEVIGVPRPRQIVLIRTSKGTLWPAGRTRGVHFWAQPKPPPEPADEVHGLVHPDLAPAFDPFSGSRAAPWHRIAFVVAVVLVGIAIVLLWLGRTAFS